MSSANEPDDEELLITYVQAALEQMDQGEQVVLEDL